MSDPSRLGATRPLHGLPVAVKDVLDTADLSTGYGSPIRAGHRPHADAACVAWTRAAAGVIHGIEPILVVERDGGRWTEGSHAAGWACAFD